jgi:CRP/FNR family transcriptional regulator
MLTLGSKTAREKVASLLHRIAARQDRADNSICRFELPLTRREIGDFLGLTIETVSRQMTRLRQDGLIDVEGNRHVAILEPHRLKREAGLGD